MKLTAQQYNRLQDDLLELDKEAEVVALVQRARRQVLRTSGHDVNCEKIYRPGPCLCAWSKKTHA